MFIVEVPSDSLFMLRFSGTVYHQFGPAAQGKDAFFAISVHTNEAAGLEGPLLDIVRAGKGNIPLLTEPIPDAVSDLLERACKGCRSVTRGGSDDDDGDSNGAGVRRHRLADGITRFSFDRPTEFHDDPYGTFIVEFDAKHADAAISGALSASLAMPDGSTIAATEWNVRPLR